jgi:hypothetical protein
MNLFGYNIHFSKAPAKAVQTTQSDWQLRPRDGQGPYTSYFSNYIARKVDPSFYEFLREAIPIIDGAINRLVVLDGHLEVTGENEALVEEIQEWVYNVPVNDIQKGLQAFHQNFTNEAFEQGFALGEFVTDKKRTDIVGLRVADSKYIQFKRSQAGLDMYQRTDNDPDWRLLNPSNLLYFSIGNENQNPCGIPLMRSCEFVSKILATMHNSLLNVWERFGDPSFSIVYKTSRRDGNDLKERRNTIQSEFDKSIRAKREGKSADFVRAIDKDSDIQIAVIGADGQILELEVPARHVVEQIIAKTGLPPWSLGLQWSTTERLADNQAELLLADISTRQAAKLPHFYNLIRTLLLLRGRTWKKGDWKLEWAQVNLRDVLKQAQARFMNAQADMYYSQMAGNTIELTAKPGRAPKAAVSEEKRCGAHAFHEGCKEASRPTPWPELDKVEQEYEDRLKADWLILKERVLTILKLSNHTTDLPALITAKAGIEGLSKDPIPTIDTFTFTDGQRVAIMNALRETIGIYDPSDPNSPVRWYYAQSYSLGLIQAAKLIAKERPILDIIKNAEIYDNLCTEGFTLVKNDATKLIANKIMPEMEAQVLAGTNSRHVASRLESIFGKQNSDWERLARTEMTMSAESAKIDEWRQWKVTRVEFVPAPDACPICLALAGEYDINGCPIPGKDTHPRDRCSTHPTISET